MLKTPPADAAHLDALWSVLGSPTEPLAQVEARAAGRFGSRAIVWEGDAATFQFSHVSRSAEALLGYPAERWTTEPGFWAETVVHPEDRHEAVAFCAVATGQGRDHDFVYRARAADGRVVWLHDVVQVILGPRDVPSRLRGVMVEVTGGTAREG